MFIMPFCDECKYWSDGGPPAEPDSAEQFPFYARRDSRALSSLPAPPLSIHPWPPSPPVWSVPGHFLLITYGICHLLASPIQTLLLRSVSPLSTSCLALGWKAGRSTEFSLPTHTAFPVACCLSEALLLALTPWLLLFCTFTSRKSCIRETAPMGV